MAIRIRKIDNQYIALCAVESDPKPDDIYLDDEIHYALAAKFCLDWQNQTVNWQYPDIWKLMETQKLRNAQEELEKWLNEEKSGNEN